MVGNMSSLKNSISHIDASLSRQPLVKGERLVRYEVNAVMDHLTDSEHYQKINDKHQCLLINVD